MDYILLLAVVPPLFLMHYVYSLDKIEKEPRGLITKLILLGMASCIPAGIIESLLCGILYNIMDPESLPALLIENFLIIAAAEEGVKLWVTKRTWKDPAFNYRFDGVVYAVAAAIGFALLENVMYVVSSDGGLMVGLMRAVTSIPGHCTFGVFMGLFYGEAKLASVRGDEALARHLMKKAYHIPILLHGFYDFILSTPYDFMIIVFYAYIFILYKYAKKRIQIAAASDEPLAPPPPENYFFNERNPFI
ncbi:MAG: PrsW family intramembrane metalloprotease [Stomatobaculum sp.]|nr:PrsW family intramembrane metalloprotease [Stomatobaculum sp.]